MAFIEKTFVRWLNTLADIDVKDSQTRNAGVFAPF